MYDHIIIGGGISGLYQARIIFQHNPNTRILIIEANNRLGGRLYSPNGHDMGGTWIWPNNDVRVLNLCKELGISKFENNDITYNHSNNNDDDDGDDDDDDIIDLNDLTNNDNHHLPEQLRFIGGSEKLIHGIVKEFPNSVNNNVSIYLEHKVIGIDMEKSKVITTNLKTNENISFHFGGTTTTDTATHNTTITLAIPPRLILRDIQFINLILSNVKKEAMENTPIWMESTSKVYLTYNTTKKIWNKNQLPLNIKGSFVFDVTNDNNNNNDNGNDNEEKEYTLCIMQVGGPGHAISKEYVSQTYLKALSHIFGQRMVSDLTQTLIHNWAEQEYTSVDFNTLSLPSSSSPSWKSQMPPSFLFGNSVLRTPIDNIFFSSTETEKEHGHIEGALKAGERAAAEVMKYVS